MVNEGTFENESEDLAQKIIDQFPADLELTAGDGHIKVTAIGYADYGAPDGAYFRTNVHIRYLAME